MHPRRLSSEHLTREAADGSGGGGGAAAEKITLRIVIVPLTCQLPKQCAPPISPWEAAFSQRGCSAAAAAVCTARHVCLGRPCRGGRVACRRRRRRPRRRVGLSAPLGGGRRGHADTVTVVAGAVTRCVTPPPPRFCAGRPTDP